MHCATGRTDIFFLKHIHFFFMYVQFFFQPYLEPRELLGAEIEKRNMKPSSFFTVSHGEISLVGADGYNDID